jgi:hypothetical protein
LGREQNYLPNPFKWAKEKLIMEIVNTTSSLMNPIDWLIPQGKSLFKALTSEKMQRRVRAIVLFLLVLVLLFIVGVIKTIQISLQLAYQEFESALRELEPVEISNSQESEPVEAISNFHKIDEVEFTSPIAVVRDTRIRALRKEASQQGIRNASRMKKEDLLMALQNSVQITHLNEVPNASNKNSRCSNSGDSA